MLARRARGARRRPNPKPCAAQEKAIYRDGCGRLKALKADVEQLQAALEHSRALLQRDFQAWFAAMAAQAQPAPQAGRERLPVVADGKQRLLAGYRAAAEEDEETPGGSWQIAARQGFQDSSQDSSSSGGGSAGALPGPLAPLGGSSSYQQRNLEYPSSSTSRAARFVAPPPLAAAPSQPTAAQQQQQPGQERSPPPAVDPEVLAAARPLLTGNPQADADIIKFYEARAALLRGMAQ